MLKSFDYSKVIRVLQILVAIGLLVLLWRLFDGGQAIKILGEANPLWLIASLVAISTQTVLSALRWRLTAGQLGLPLSRANALREYYLSQIVNQVLPGGVLGDAGRILRTRSPAGLVTSGQAVVLERIAGQVALFVLMSLAFLITLLVPMGVSWPNWLLTTVGLIAITALVLSGGIALFAKRSISQIGELLRNLGASSRLAFSSGGVLWQQVLLSSGTAVCNVAGFTFACWSVGFELSVILALAVVPIILLAMLLPVTVSGWGLREGVAVALFPIVGATITQGLAASIGFGLVCLTAAMPGLAFTQVARKLDTKSYDEKNSA